MYFIISTIISNSVHIQLLDSGKPTYIGCPYKKIILSPKTSNKV